MSTQQIVRRRGVSAALAAAALMATLTGGTAAMASGPPAAPASTMSAHAMSTHASNASRASRLAMHDTMRALWGQHMEWTYGAIATFATGSPGFPATATRLLQNQVDIGDAIKPYYGDAAGAALTGLLKTHITDVVALLEAAKAGDQTAYQQAASATYVNARQIGDFLATANPGQWSQAEMRLMMKQHIDQTVVYASDELAGNYAASITGYAVAEAHMADMADMLSAGIVAQFPWKFTR